ncbi:hypothetical protein N9L77_09850, partial [Pseudomonadales bacterium]|nr:hypothetical protein [Pseudomonadales bacterium]
SLPVTNDWRTTDVDYFQWIIRYSDKISTETVLRISIEGDSDAQNWSNNLYLQFSAQGSDDRLRFVDVNNSENTFDNFYADFNNTSSWLVSPESFQSGTPFELGAQRLDIRVSGEVSDNDGNLVVGDLANYTVRIDLALVGDDTSEEIVLDVADGYTYVEARGGDDLVVGSEASEEIVGGAGDDNLQGGAGDDVLSDSQGTNTLSGGSGDDIINLTGTSTPQGTIDGGEGIDTLRVASDTNFSNISISNVEILDGRGGRTELTPQDVIDKGFTTANNITFQLNSNNSGGELDASTLAGNFTLRGTNQSDILIGNADDNTIYLLSDNGNGSGSGQDQVQAGAGNDTIIWATRDDWSDALRFFSSADATTHTYFLEGSLDGGLGSDRLVLDFSRQHWHHNWGNVAYDSNAPSWHVDLSGLSFTSLETLDVRGYQSNNPYHYPSSFALSAAQIAGLSSVSGLNHVVVKGGGTIDLGHLASLGITSWSIGDDGAYDIVGTDAGETVTLGSGETTIALGAGDDTIRLDGKATVADVIDGGAGDDTLTITGGDVDLSGLTLTDVESIRLNVDSLSMTDVQWAELGSKITLVSGADPDYLLTLASAGAFEMSETSDYVGVYGSAGDDVLTGNALDNRLDGRAGNDVIAGGDGADVLVSGSGVDSLSGGAGDDTLIVTDKALVTDTLSGGAGTDTLVVTDGQDFTGSTLTGLERLSGSGTVTLTQAQTLQFEGLGSVSVVMVVDGASADYAIEKDVTGAINLANADGSNALVLPEQVIEVRFSDKSYLVETAFTGFGESQVNTHTDRNQDRSVVAGLSDGGYVIVWQSHDQDYQYRQINGQRYDKEGNFVGIEFTVTSDASAEIAEATVTSLADGGFVVAWMNNGADGSEWGVFAQRFDSAGLQIDDQFQVNTYTSNEQRDPQLVGLESGGFFVIWQSYGQDGSSYPSWGIYGQLFDASGSPVGDEVHVSSFYENDQQSPSVSSLPDGGFIAVWMSYGQDNSEWGIFGQRFSPDGQMVGTEFQINTSFSSNQYNPAIAVLDDGSFVVTWMINGQDGSGWGIFGQRIDSSGFFIGDQFQVNTSTQGQQEDPEIIALSDGGFVVTWKGFGYRQDTDQYDWGVYGQRFDEFGQQEGDEFLVNRLNNNNQQDHAIAGLNDGSFVVTWQSGDIWGNGVYQQRFVSGTQIVDGEIVIGGESDDVLVGGAGSQTLVAGSGFDVVDGGAGYNIVEVSGTPDGYSTQINRAGVYVLRDLVIGGDDLANQSNEGQTTLRNIQAIRFVSGKDGAEILVEIDDHGNFRDSENDQIDYGVVISGRINFQGDQDYFVIDSTKGDKVAIESLIGNGGLRISTTAFGAQDFWGSNESREYSQNIDGLTEFSLTHSNQFPGSSDSPSATQAYSLVLRRV